MITLYYLEELTMKEVGAVLGDRRIARLADSFSGLDPPAFADGGFDARARVCARRSGVTNAEGGDPWKSSDPGRDPCAISSGATGRILGSAPPSQKQPQKMTNFDAARGRPHQQRAGGAISDLHESFARNLTNSLGAFLRVGFDVNLVSVEQLNYSEVLSRLPELTYLCSSAHPADGSLRLAANGPVDRLSDHGPGFGRRREGFRGTARSH